MLPIASALLRSVKRGKSLLYVCGEVMSWLTRSTTLVVR